MRQIDNNELRKEELKLFITWQHKVLTFYLLKKKLD